MKLIGSILSGNKVKLLEIMSILVLFLSWSGIAFPEDLAFTTKELHIAPEIAKNEGVFDFKFTCAAKSPVTIKNYASQCPCIELASDKEVYNPGESGVIHVKLKYADMSGKLRKRVSVVSAISERKDDEKTDLFIEGNIQSALESTQKIAIWPNGSENIKRSVEFLVRDGYDLKDIKVLNPDENKNVSVSSAYDPKVKKIVFTIRLTATDILKLGGSIDEGFWAMYRFEYRVMPLDVVKSDAFTASVYMSKGKNANK